MSNNPESIEESRRRWCFEKAMQIKGTADVTNMICMASEIEEYITQGRSTRVDFMHAVAEAMNQVERTIVVGVSESKKRVVIDNVRDSLSQHNVI